MAALAGTLGRRAAHNAPASTCIRRSCRRCSPAIRVCLLCERRSACRNSVNYSGRFNPRNSSIRMRSRALVVRSISSWRRRANDFIEWSSVSSSNRSSTHVSAHDRTVWTTPMSIHHRPYCPFIALHVARVRLLSVVSFSKIWAPASDTLFPVAAVRYLLRYRRLSGRIARSCTWRRTGWRSRHE